MFNHPFEPATPHALRPQSLIATLDEVLDGKGSWSVGRDPSTAQCYCELLIEGTFWRWQAATMEEATRRALDCRRWWDPSPLLGLCPTGPRLGVPDAPTAL